MEENHDKIGIPECYVTSLNEFNDVIDQIESDKAEYVYYRGNSQSDFNLTPSIGRVGELNYTKEFELFEEFKRTNRQYFNYPHTSALDVLAIAQHHGLKTRLLDWTDNPLSALWFAFNEYNRSIERSDSYCVVWVLSPSEINSNTKDIFVNQTVLNNEGKELQEIIEDIFGSKEQKRCTDKEGNNEEAEVKDRKNPGAKIFLPNYVANRIKNQQGLFTIHDHCFKEESNIVRFLPLEEDQGFLDQGWRLTKILFNRERYGESIMQRLKLFGVHEEFIYPTLDSLCKKLNQKLAKI